MNCPQCRKLLTPVGSFWVCPQHGSVQPEPATTPPANAKKTRLFLSYGRRDATDLAERLRGDLEARGYEIWQDTRRIRSGREWEQEIQDGLHSAQVVIALLSPHAVRMAHDPSSPDSLDSVCLDEISFARFAEPPKQIIPVMAKTCQPPFCIFRLDYVDLCAWKEAEDCYQRGLARLLESIDVAVRGGGPRFRTWDDQLRPFDFAAYMNEKRRHFCGREWLFDEIEAWRASSQERVLLITGDPGVGKSAIVAELVHRNPGGQVMAYHCCQADTAATLQPGPFVRSLASMIASALPGYAAKLAEPAVNDALKEEKCISDPGTGFEHGILSPLESLPAPDEGVRYVLVDALDEALKTKGTTIVDVLAPRLRRLPAWLRVVATTRRDPSVLRELSGLRAQQLDASDPRNLSDIDRYIAKRIAEPNLAERLAASRCRSEDARRMLCEKADGNFLYAEKALESIEHDQQSFDRLQELPTGLNAWYIRNLRQHFQDIPELASYAKARRLLQVVVAAREPLTAELICQAAQLDVEEEFRLVLRPLVTYVPERDKRFTTYHKSFADWLMSSRETNEYYVSEKRGHERLADSCWEEFRRCVETVSDVETMSDYAKDHLAHHLVAVSRWAEMEKLLNDRSFLLAKAGIYWTQHYPGFVAAAKADGKAERLKCLPSRLAKVGWELLSECNYGDGVLMFHRAFSACLSIVKQDPAQSQWLVEFVEQFGNLPGFFSSRASEEAGHRILRSWDMTLAFKGYVQEQCREALSLLEDAGGEIPSHVREWLVAASEADCY